jgi:glucuronoarabinoxylan endo-1,4-beta-xylanase
LVVRYYGPISDGTNDCGRKGEVTKKGYVMSQYSRFIRPGYYRVECNILPWSCNVYVTAYKDSSSSKAVIVAVNNNSAPLDLAIRIQNGSMNQFTPYSTTEFKNCVQGDDINIMDNRFIFQLEASSVTTFVSK